MCTRAAYSAGFEDTVGRGDVAFSFLQRTWRCTGHVAQAKRVVLPSRIFILVCTVDNHLQSNVLSHLNETQTDVNE